MLEVSLQLVSLFAQTLVEQDSGLDIKYIMDVVCAQVVSLREMSLSLLYLFFKKGELRIRGTSTVAGH